MIALWLMFWLLVKHFLCDFPLQANYMLEEKGTYLKDGGIHHAFLHGICTVIVFSAMGYYEVAGNLAVIDILIHYHVDYLKVRLGRRFSWDPSKKAFWTALGVDQFVHQATYVLLVWLALNK